MLDGVQSPAWPCHELLSASTSSLLVSKAATLPEALCNIGV